MTTLPTQLRTLRATKHVHVRNIRTRTRAQHVSDTFRQCLTQVIWLVGHGPTRPRHGYDTPNPNLKLDNPYITQISPTQIPHSLSVSLFRSSEKESWWWWSRRRIGGGGVLVIWWWWAGGSRGDLIVKSVVVMVDLRLRGGGSLFSPLSSWWISYSNRWWWIFGEGISLRGGDLVVVEGISLVVDLAVVVGSWWWWTFGGACDLR